MRRDDGSPVGMSDLWDPASALSGEYDGGGHREEARHAVDNVREEGFERLGITVVRLTRLDLLSASRVRTCHRLRTAYADASRRPPGAWTWEPGPLPTPVPHW